MTADSYRSLADLAFDFGEEVHCAGNRPLDMGDLQFVLFVEKGAVDLFLVERSDGKDLAAPQHFLRAVSGDFLPGVEALAGETTLQLVAKGLPGTVLRRLSVVHLALLDHAELATHVNAWLIGVSKGLSRDVLSRPLEDTGIQIGLLQADRNETLSARHGVVWISGLARGAGLFMDLVDPLEQMPDGAFPLTSASWITMTNGAALNAQSSESLAREGRLLEGLGIFHGACLELERLNRFLSVVDEANLDIKKRASRRAAEEDARHRLFDMYGDSPKERSGTYATALAEALRLIGRDEKIVFRDPEGGASASETEGLLENVLDASEVRGRQVRLNPDEKWWIGDNGAMLAFRTADDQPVALLPGILGRYWEADPITGNVVRMTAKRADMLSSEAWSFYPSLPPEGLRLLGILDLAPKRLATDFLRIVVSGFLGCAIMLLPVLVLWLIVEVAIPNDDVGLLYAATGMLASSALIMALLHVLRTSAQMRIGIRVAGRLEAAFWDRLVRLQSSKLSGYAVGDVCMRSTAFWALRDALHGLAANCVVTVAFLLPFIFLVGFLAPHLGAAAITLGLLSLIVTVALGIWQVVPHAKIARINRGLAGKLHEVLSGIFKLRGEGAEGSAFAVWARQYRRQKQAELELSRREGFLHAFCAALPLISTALLLLAAISSDFETIGVGEFLVVYSAFMLLQAAIVRLGLSFGAIAEVIAALEGAKPILVASLDDPQLGQPVNELKGEILFDHVTFRYDVDGPLILNDVSIHVLPGEFVAIVGESGAGKSTLFRLAMGEVQPYSGTVYFDGRDLKHLNVKQVRRRIGVVPQGVGLHPDDVWDNIAGHHKTVSSDEILRACELANVRQEIMAMPMGLATAVGAGGDVLSGGEIQRIMIGHAMMRNPRIMLLDEATNWLDNNRQATVMHNLSLLTSTRIVIAHRLSTLRHADRIYVLQEGKVAQTGTFAELSDSEGPFRELIRRQLA